MPGPAPKLQRQRRGSPARGDWQKLEPLAKLVLPELDTFPAPVMPPRWDKDARDYTDPTEMPWPHQSVRLWNAWRKSPVTAIWSEDDVAFAIDTIYLHAEATLGGRGAPPAEIRLRQESLGLTPKGRKDNRLLLPDEEPDEPAELVSIKGGKKARPEAI